MEVICCLYVSTSSNRSPTWASLEGALFISHDWGPTESNSSHETGTETGAPSKALTLYTDKIVCPWHFGVIVLDVAVPLFTFRSRVTFSGYARWIEARTKLNKRGLFVCINRFDRHVDVKPCAT